MDVACNISYLLSIPNKPHNSYSVSIILDVDYKICTVKMNEKLTSYQLKDKKRQKFKNLNAKSLYNGPKNIFPITYFCG